MSENDGTSRRLDGQKAFDFLIGHWNVHNRRLKGLLTGSTTWYEFAGTLVVRPVWGGRANTDEFEAETPMGRIEGMTVRLYDADSDQWTIYWANAKNGKFDQPMVGSFKEGRGEFYDQELFEGKAIFVRFIWTSANADACRWEQAFSADGGRTWETNWVMDLTRRK